MRPIELQGPEALKQRCVFVLDLEVSERLLFGGRASLKPEDLLRCFCSSSTHPPPFSISLYAIPFFIQSDKKTSKTRANSAS